MSTIIAPHIWYFPSTYGDIRLEAVSERKTKLIYFKLTPTEVKAMQDLRSRSTATLRGWTSIEAWDKVQPRDFETGEAAERVIELGASITRIGDFLSARLRPDRQTITVVRSGQGEIREMKISTEPETAAESTTTAESEPAADNVVPIATQDEPDVTPRDEPLAATGTDSTEPVKAATIKKPTRGCPAPSFEQIRLRATRVLRAFLTPQQAADFNQHQRFVSTGKDTGHRYMLTSRNAPDQLQNFGSRCLFDLDENRAYCVHDWDVPAEEELLALHCLLSLPGHETWARAMPDLGGSHEGASADLDLLLAGV